MSDRIAATLAVDADGAAAEAAAEAEAGAEAGAEDEEAKEDEADSVPLPSGWYRTPLVLLVCGDVAGA